MSRAWTIEKDVVLPGRVTVPGPSGQLTYTFTPDDLVRIGRTGNAKIGDGWNIPLAWEHQPVEPGRGNQPATLAADVAALRLSQSEQDAMFARSVFGKAKQYRLAPNGRLRVVLTGEDPDDLEQFKKVDFVSPEIAWDWIDTDGKLWPGPTITHIAATPRPVQRQQDAVTDNLDGKTPSINLSLRGNRCEPARSLGELICWGRRSGENGSRVARRLRLSLDHYDASGGSAVADDLDTTFDTGTSKKSPWERIAESLMKCGVKIGDGKNVKDADHLADLIDVAALNCEQDLDDMLPDDEDDEGGMGDQPPPGDLDAPPAGATEPTPPPVQMSQTVRRAVEKAKAEAESYARENLHERVRRLERTGRVTPSKAAEIRAGVDRVQLSFTGAGKLARNDVIVRIETLEGQPANSAWSRRSPAAPARGKRVKMSVRGNATRPVDRSPYHEHGEDDVDALVLAYEANVGRTGIE